MSDACSRTMTATSAGVGSGPSSSCLRRPGRQLGDLLTERVHALRGRHLVHAEEVINQLARRRLARRRPRDRLAAVDARRLGSVEHRSGVGQGHSATREVGLVLAEQGEQILRPDGLERLLVREPSQCERRYLLLLRGNRKLNSLHSAQKSPLRITDRRTADP